MAHVLVLACIRHSVMPSPTTATWRFVEDATVRLRVDMSSGTVHYTAHCGIWWVRLLVCSCVASFVRVFVRLFVFLPLFVCRYSFVVRSLAFGMLFVVRAFQKSVQRIPLVRPLHKSKRAPEQLAVKIPTASFNILTCYVSTVSAQRLQK